MAYGEEIEKAVSTYQQLVGYEQRLAQADGSLVADLFEQAVADRWQSLVTICSQKAVAEVISDREGLDKAIEDLDQLEADGVIDPDVIGSRRETITALGELGTRFFDMPERVTAELSDGEEAVNDFFERPAKVVADDLIGMVLKVNGRKAVITSTFAQDGKFNDKYRDDPIFGKNRVDAEVLPTHGHYILYLRAGSRSRPYECVRIKGVQIGDEVHGSASKVTKALDLEQSLTATIRLENGQTLSIVRLAPYEDK